MHEHFSKGRHRRVGLVCCYFLLRGVFMKTEEDEEFERIEREQKGREAEGWRKRQILTLRTSFESFDEWEHSHRPEQYFVERRAYLAGFEAGRRYERLKEAND